MKWMLSCKEITEICCDEDRKLSIMEKLKFWMHLGICKACHAYKKQIEFISEVMKNTFKERSKADEKKVSKIEQEVVEKFSKRA